MRYGTMQGKAVIQLSEKMAQRPPKQGKIKQIGTRILPQTRGCKATVCTRPLSQNEGSRKMKEHPIYPKYCVNCKSEFMPNIRNPVSHIFCSPKCRPSKTTRFMTREEINAQTRKYYHNRKSKKQIPKKSRERDEM